MIRRASVLVAALVLVGCATTQVTAFRDPGFANKRFSKLAIFALGLRLDARVNVEHDICQKLEPTPCVSGIEILPPTRVYETEEVTKAIERAGADGVLILSLATDQANTSYAGTKTDATASASSTTTGTASVFGNFGMLSSSTTQTAKAEAVSTPIYSHTREATGYLGVFDRATGSAAWRGEIRISGATQYAVSDNEFIRSATSRVAKEVRNAGLVK